MGECGEHSPENSRALPPRSRSREWKSLTAQPGLPSAEGRGHRSLVRGGSFTDSFLCMFTMMALHTGAQEASLVL